ncbi:MAG: hypothetical protein ACOCR0_02090, partial [Haloferacaceae archaeon]
MAAEVDTFLRRVQDPRYTGENRCLPCTIVNVGLAAIVAAGLGVGARSLELGVGAFVLALGVIWAKGYLVPGTPTLTKRYLPDRVLRWFEKEPGPVDGHVADAETVDPEAFLWEHDLVVEDPVIDDLVLEPTFESSLLDRVEAFESPAVSDEASEAEPDTDEASEAGLEVLAEMLDVDPGRLSTTHHGQAFAAYLDAEYVGQWESRAAFVADAAAARAIEERVPEWDRLAVPTRSNILAAVRL